MSENSDKDSQELKDSTNKTTEKSSDENISVPESENIISNQEPENMEVHHHPSVENKSLKGYILEGLMIFMAVTLGYFAENIREHITEHRNARILAQSMLEDIKKDTTSLNEEIAFSHKKLKAADSIVVMLHSPREKWNNTSFYKNMATVLTTFPFAPTDGTFAQMKASGSLRYFNQSLVNEMNAYDVQLKKTGYRDNVEDNGVWSLASLVYNVMNLEVLTDLRFNKPITHDMYIILDNSATINKFINLVVMMKNFRGRTLMEYEVQLKLAKKLIDSVNKEYH